MSYNNVNLWFAKDTKGNIVTINDVNNEEKYYCPICGSEVKAVAVGGKTKKGEIAQVTSHFSHFDANKCSSESMIHFWFKHKFLVEGDKFTITTKKEIEYVCKEVLVEKTYTIEDKTYRPDVTVITECGETIYFEMAHKNKKKIEDYIDLWLGLSNTVVEIELKHLTNSADINKKFKVLFHKGQCYNTKRNDSYYNTIGRYKERTFSKESNDEIRKRIRRLDWFWNDVLKYKTNEVDILHMIDIIDAITNEDDREIVFNILHKSYCNKLYNDYINKKAQLVLKEVEKISKDLISDAYEINISELTKNCWSGFFEREISFYDIEEHSVRNISIIDYSVNDIISKLGKVAEEFNARKKHKNDLIFIKNNKAVKDAILEIDMHLKSIDKNYKFYDRFGYDMFISLCYVCDTKLDIDIRYNDDIIYSKDKEFIKSYFMSEVDKYMNTVKPFKNKEFIINTIEKANEKLNKIQNKEKYWYREKVSKRRYKEYSKIQQYNYGAECRIIGQDAIEIKFFKNENYKRNLKSEVLIYQNKLCYSDRYIPSFRNDIDTINKYIIKTFADENEWTQLYDILLSLFSKSIKADLEFVCFSCNNKFECSEQELKFYIEKELHLPIRCNDCRKQRRK